MDMDSRKFLNGLKKISQGKKKVSEDSLLKVFAKTFPESYYSSKIDYQRLLELLQELFEQGLIDFPSDKNWNHTMKLSLPRWIVILDTKKKPLKKDVHSIPWHPALSWISTVQRLNQNTIINLIKLNDFIVSRGLQELKRIPIKERSLEIFGNEKILDKWVNRSWFSEHITLEQLGCYKTYEPFAAKITSQTDNHRAIIIENRDTFDSFWRSNEQVAPPPYNYVIYGHGKAIEERILWIKDFDTEITTIDYFGDLDQEGINIPYRTNQKLIENDYAQRIRMALPFYLRLIEVYRKKHPISLAKEIQPRKCLNFLPSNEKQYVESLFRQDERIPQEMLKKNAILEILLKVFSS